MTTEHIHAIPQVNYEGLRQHLHSSIAVNNPIYIHGASGIGKTAVVEQFAAEYANAKSITVKFSDLFLVALDSLDFSGLPVVIDNKATFAPSQLIPIKGDEDVADLVLVFLDEIPLAQPSVQSACYKLLQERRLGQSEIHENVRFVLAGNRVKDRGNHNQVPAPLNNRCFHVELMIDAVGFLDWAEDKLHPRITGFLGENSGCLHAALDGDEKFRESIKNPAWPSQRAWHQASDRLFYADENNLTGSFRNVSVAGCVGESMGATFRAFEDLCGDVPPMADILAGKAKTTPIDGQLQYYTVMSVTGALSVRFGQGKEVDVNNQEYIGMMENAYKFVKAVCTPERTASYIALITQKRKLPINTREMKTLVSDMLMDKSSELTDYNNENHKNL